MSLEHFPKLKMDLSSINFIACLLFLSFILALFKHQKKHKEVNENTAQKLKVPSPWKLPLIRNMHLLMGSSPPHHTLRNLSNKYGSLMHLQLGEISTVVVSSSRLAEDVLKTHDLAFANRPQFRLYKIVLYNCSEVAFSPYGDYWRQMRKTCILELLSVKTVRSFDSIRHDEALKLVESIKAAAGGTVALINLREKLYEYTSSMVSRAAFGKVRKEDRKAFFEALNESLSVSINMDFADLFPSLKILHPLFSIIPKLVRMQKKFDEGFNNIIDQHRDNRARTKKGMGESGQEDLIDVLLRVKESGDLQIPITENNIKGVLMDIFTGATENSSTIVEWAMSEMIKNPNVMAKAQGEVREAFIGKKTILEADIQGLEYLKSVIKETLRLHPIVPFLVPRECREECEIDGYNIPVNTVVMINVWALGRDPVYWEDPDSFKPERFENVSVDFKGSNFHYLPFGAGRRICPGVSFGLANVELPLALLLYHFDWKLPNGLNPVDLDMTETIGVTAMRKKQPPLVS